MRILARGDSRVLALALARVLQNDHAAIARAYPNPCALFDVDDCLLWWHEDEVHERRLETATLFETIQAIGWPIFIVTARPKTRGGLDDLQRQLHDELGYRRDGIQRYYMMPREYDDPGEYKADVREHVQREFGHTCVLMCGDAWTDVVRHGDPRRLRGGARLNEHTSYLLTCPDAPLADGTPSLVYALKLSAAPAAGDATLDDDDEGEG